MLQYFKMKKAEIRFKLLVYETMNKIIDNQKELKNMADLIQKLYLSLKDVPAEDLREELIAELAGLIHAESNAAES